MGLRLLALACLVGAAFAGPFQRETGSQCSVRCPHISQPNFDYEVDKKYVYEYRGENYITAAGQRKQKATIEGLAEFHWNTKCEGVLKLKNVRIQQKLSPEEIDNLVQELEIPVSYAFEDGKIEKVCPTSEESTQSLNIKKGILSTMINTMTRLDTPQQIKEVDSLGTCVTKYTVKYSNGLEVQKEKNLKSCTNRHSSVTSLITNDYESPESHVHTLPIFPEEQLVCKQRIEDKIIKTVECREKATIKPLKHRESVIEFEGVIELSLLNKNSAEQFRSQKPRSQEAILYNLEPEQSIESLEREVQHLLTELCSKNRGTIDVSVSQDFIKLVSIVKTLPHKSLDETYKSLKNGQLCSSKKVLDIFVDTLPMAGSEASVKLMVQLLEDKEITGLKAKLWPASLALIPKPTQKTVKAVLPLMQMIDSAPVLLGVSAMLHRFCSTFNCYQENTVQEIVSALNEHLGHDCSNTEEERVFKILKAFGNIGYLGQAKSNVIACAKDSSKPLRLRLAAIDAFRRTTEKRPQELVDIYSDRDEHSELRMAALSSILRKADQQQIRLISRIAKQETDEQVSAYTSTIINNMRKTSSPLKKNVKKLLQEIEVSTPKVNYWQNSKNIELSAFSEAINVGAAIEADIIHSSDSKIPRSIYTRFDVDVFDKSMNLFEVGVRAEGLEALLQKLIGLKDKLPQAKSWDLLSAKSLFGEMETDASLFIRTMNTEIFDVAASDLSAMGELVQFAEIMKKMVQEKSADFSHSFLFVNSELVIPSVTGRSYAIALTGSATVGLTAKSKLDVLSFPRSTDVQAHFQPSANVEISTTVGIQSNKQRPDIKLVSRMHLESHMEAKFQIKDGHVALLSVSMPSENVAMAKISSDVVEIDAQHNERRVFEKMQSKIDYCFDHLQKVLGVSVCGKWNVPKPFITKSFPFVNGVGSVELAIKKSDPSLTSYELSVEIPKHAGPVMKYKASLDTPGTQISRRFAAEFDVKQRSRHQKQFSLELTSPFKILGGSGSYTHKENLMQCSLEVHGTSSRLFSFNASSEIASSRYRTIFKPTLVASWKNKEPVQLEGAISVIRGKKEQITFDIKSKKTSERPLVLKGTIMKEGQLEISETADWKVSSDVNVECLLGEAQIHSAVEKRSKQSQLISTSFSADYQLRNQQKHELKFITTAQKKLSKLSTNAQFECTQFPSRNWVANWDMQGELRQNLKNDITLKYGLNPEETYVNIKHMSSIPPQGRGECKVAVKAPQFNINSELTVSHEIELSETPKLHLEADLGYAQDKHVKSLIDIDCKSRQPLKASSRIELEYSGRKISYSDEIEQTGQKAFEGRSRLQWKEDSHVEVKYKYQNLSDHSVLHHEIETSLQTPLRPLPIKSKASLRLSEKSMGVQGQLNLNRNTEYGLSAQLHRMGVSLISVNMPQVEGILKVSNDEQKKGLDLDMKLKVRNPRHVIGSALIEMQDKKKFKMELQLDADRNPEQRILASTVILTKSGKSFTSSSKLQILDYLSLSLAEFGEISPLGDHEGTIEVSLKNRQPITLKYKQELSQNRMKCSVEYSKNNIQKAEIQIEGNYLNDRYAREIAARASVKCLDNSFESKEFSMRHQLSRSGPSTSLKSEMKLQNGQMKTYKAEWNTEMQPSGLEMNAKLNTPHENFEKQAVSLSYQRSKSALSCSISAEIPNNKVLSISADVQKKSRGLSASVNVKSPFDVMRDSKIYMSMENQRSKKSLQSSIEINNNRMADIEANYASSSYESNYMAQIKFAPMKNIEFQGMKIAYQRTRSSASVGGKIYLTEEREVTGSVELQKERENLSATATLETPFMRSKSAKMHLSLKIQPSSRDLLFYIDANENRKCDCEIHMLKSSKGLEMRMKMKTNRTPEITSHLKLERIGQSFSVSSKIVRGPSPLQSVNAPNLQRQHRSEISEQSERFQKILLDLEISNKVSEENLKFALKANGPFAPLSLSLSSQRSEKNSLNIEGQACREAEEKSCYNIKASHKSLNQEESYRIYRKVTVNLEKSSSHSETQQLGNIQLFLSAGDHDYRSKVLVQLKHKNLGYEVRVHRRSHENDHCSIVADLYMPERTSRVRASVVHNKQEKMIELETVPDIEEPSKKFSLELKKEHNHQNKEIACFVKAICPSMTKPISFAGRLQRQGRFLVKARAELQYSSQWGKGLILDITPEMHSGKKQITCTLYREDKSLEASVVAMKHSAQDEDKYEYEWSWKSSQQMKKGGASIHLSQKSKGRPQKINISYFTPSVDYKIQGDVAWTPEVPEINLSVMSRGQDTKEIVIRTTPDCVLLDVNRSGSSPQFKSSFCLNKREGNAIHFVSISAHYNQKRILDVQVGVNPEKPEFLDVVLEWKKAELLQAFTELTGLEELLNDRSLEHLEEELREHIQHIIKDVIRPFIKDLLRQMKDMKREQSRRLRQTLQGHSQTLKMHWRKLQNWRESAVEELETLIPVEYLKTEVWEPLKNILECVTEKYTKVVSEHIPELLNVVFDIIKAQFEQCMEKFCSKGTFCHSFMRSYQRNGIRQVRQNLKKRVTQAKRTLTQKWQQCKDQLQFPDFMSDIQQAIEFFEELFDRYFDKFLAHKLVRQIAEYSKQIESEIREKAIDLFDYALQKFSEFISHAERDEDFRTAKALVKTAERKLRKAWSNKEQLAKKALQPMEDSVMKTIQKTLQDKLEVEEYSPKDGQIRFRVRNPLSPSHIQVIQNELKTIKRKIQQSISV